MKPVTEEMRRAMQEAGELLQLADAESMRLGQQTGADVSVIRESIELAANRLQRALMLQRVVSGRLSVTPHPASIAELIDDVLAETLPMLAHPDMLETAVAASLEDWSIDRELVREILSNALINAAHHARGAVRLAARAEGPMLVLEVEDDGPGFPSVDPEYFHERGFGLHVAQTCAAGHVRDGLHGSVELGRGMLGGGCFRLRLP